MFPVHRKSGIFMLMTSMIEGTVNFTLFKDYIEKLEDALPYFQLSFYDDFAKK